MNKKVNMRFVREDGTHKTPNKGELCVITSSYNLENKKETIKYVGFYLGFDNDGNCLFATDNESNKDEATLIFEPEESEFIKKTTIIKQSR